MERIDLSGEPKLPASRREIVDDYTSTLTARDTEMATAIAGQIQAPSTPLARTQVLIPVAAHQEAAQVPNTLEQYAHQQTDHPFTIILGLNSPVSQVENPQINHTLQAIEQAKRDYPELDVHTTMTVYEQPTIGMVRRDLWNGALLASRQQGYYDNKDDEIIGINHDIDLISMSPRYIARVQQSYDRQQHTSAGRTTATPLSVARTGIHHALSPDHPNISKGIFWSDFLRRQEKQSLEAGLIIPFSYYAQKGGFDQTTITHECAKITAGLARIDNIPGTTMRTSPRRYIDRLHYGYGKIWTSETFGATDICREESRQGSDISFDQLEEIIDRNGYLAASALHVAIKAINTRTNALYGEGFSVDDISHYELLTTISDVIHAKSNLFGSILERIIEASALAEKARQLDSDNAFHETISDIIFNTND